MHNCFYMFFRLIFLFLVFSLHSVGAADNKTDLHQFCTVTNGFNIAKRGGLNPETCTGNLGVVFLEGFNDGRRLRNHAVRLKNARTDIKNAYARIENSKSIILQKQTQLKNENNQVRRKFLKRDINSEKKRLNALNRSLPKLDEELANRENELKSFVEYVKKYQTGNQLLASSPFQNEGKIIIPAVIIFKPNITSDVHSEAINQQLKDLRQFLPKSDHRQFSYQEVTNNQSITFKTAFGEYAYKLDDKQKQAVAFFSDSIGSPKMLVLDGKTNLIDSVKDYFNVFSREHFKGLVFSLAAESDAPDQRKQKFLKKYTAFIQSFEGSTAPTLTSQQVEKVNASIMQHLSAFSVLIEYSKLNTRNYFRKPFKVMRTFDGFNDEGKVHRDKKNHDIYQHELKESNSLQQRYFKYNSQGGIEKIIHYQTEVESSFFDAAKIETRNKNETHLFWESEFVLNIYEDIRVSSAWGGDSLKDIRGYQLVFNPDYTLSTVDFFSYNHEQQTYKFNKLSSWEYLDGGDRVIQKFENRQPTTYLYKDGQVVEIIHEADEKIPNSVFLRVVTKNNEVKLYDETGKDVTRFPQKYFFDKQHYLIKSEGHLNAQYLYER